MNIRDEIIEALKREVIGPSPNAEYLDEDTGEELLLTYVHGTPKSRYGAGMLYPQLSANQGIVDSEVDYPYDDSNEEDKEVETRTPLDSKTENFSGDEHEEEPVGMANQYLPSAMGFTLRFRGNEKNDLVKIEVKSAYYELAKDKKSIKSLNKNGEVIVPKTQDGKTIDSPYSIRRPIEPDPIYLNLNKLFAKDSKTFNVPALKKNPKGEDWLILRVFNRTTKEDRENDLFTFTFVLINNLLSSTEESSNSNKILYQNELKLSTENNNLIVPYKEKNLRSDTMEEKELNLLYRKKRIFSIGHGTSVEWLAKTDNEQQRETVQEVKTSVIPEYDLRQVAPTAHVTLSMLELSDLGDWKKACESLEKLRDEYAIWIDGIDALSKSSQFDNYRPAATSNVAKCRDSLSRISKGIDLLLSSNIDSDIVKCFRWMNRAMIWQQQRSKAKIRKFRKSGSGDHTKLVLDYLDEEKKSHDFDSLETFHEGKYNGKWRPFQIAFVLMNLESVTDLKSKEREIVDLIWFPTGGGKTEAYLGLTAFNIFFRRIKGKVNTNWDHYGGTTVLMRYTLRLLTTQQYERAASLICACDLIRLENKKKRESNLEYGELGEEPISIGLWVGGASTPNDVKQARSQLGRLKRDPKEEYNFVVMKCPCCGTQIGKVDNVKSADKVQLVTGIHKEDGKNGEVYFKCENKSCEYSEMKLPLQVVDESIYNNPPTLLLGTVDKFAMIPWKERAGELFGFRKENPTNIHRISPPELIIQDELHLIAGPLGTMVGLYETMIQTLCNNYENTSAPFISAGENSFIPPKIVASSATISRAYEQVKSLYGIKSREQVCIFPAQGLDFGDTWFSEEKSLEKFDGSGQLFPGRKYLGVLASGYPSSQTAIVRSYATVLQRIKELSKENDDKNINYYWTLLGYFNSIRELGGASSLVHGDIIERLGQIQSREITRRDFKRYLNRIEELTSRISSSEIPVILKKLETNFNSGKTQSLDICLATNMVATGVDISRLGLMFIHGQPKTTAEYIQASSRVGRDVPSGPGLIVTLYSPSKPRDKSQYEQFQGYHSRIYSNVEPTSVTPFSINAREKGLHAVLISLIRHFSSNVQGLVKFPVTDEEFEELSTIFKKIIVKRCEVIDQDEVSNTLRLLEKRIKAWEKGGAENYGDAANYGILQNEDYFPLMYASSAEIRENIEGRLTPFSTPTSMRGVDTESVLNIYFNSDEDE